MTAVAERTTLRCPDCMGPMKLRPGKFGHFYACQRWPDCRGAHGAHPDGAPKGFPGNAATRAARIRAHEAFDTLWESGGMTRSAAYRWLQAEMKVTKRAAHIAKFTEAQCELLIAKINEREDAL